MAAPAGLEESDAHDHGHHGGGHHVLSAHMLTRVFGALIFLTILTVVLALFERGYADVAGARITLLQIHLGAFSVPVALAIAAMKAGLVAAFFMNLRHDRGTPLLAFVASIIFLIIFVSITYLDTGFRDTFEEQSAVPVDVAQERILEAQRREAEIEEAFRAVPLVGEPDAGLFSNPVTEPGVGGGVTPVAPVPGADGSPDGTATPSN